MDLIGGSPEVLDKQRHDPLVPDVSALHPVSSCFSMHVKFDADAAVLLLMHAAITTVGWVYFRAWAARRTGCVCEGCERGTAHHVRERPCTRRPRWHAAAEVASFARARQLFCVSTGASEDSLHCCALLLPLLTESAAICMSTDARSNLAPQTVAPAGFDDMFGDTDTAFGGDQAQPLPDSKHRVRTRANTLPSELRRNMSCHAEKGMRWVVCFLNFATRSI